MQGQNPTRSVRPKLLPELIPRPNKVISYFTGSQG